jgi:MIP family channel proteins
MKKSDTFKVAVAEALGTFTIVFAGCGGLMVAERFPGSIPNGAIPVVFGLVVSIMIYALGHISGAHFNPAVTFAFAAILRFPAKKIPLYLVSQLVGAFAAMVLLVAILPGGESFGATIPKLVTPLQAVLWEAVMTFFLMFVVMGVATDSRSVGAMAGLAIGATVAVDAFIGGPVTGASMNPIRSLAPAFYQGRVDVMWIYFLGPCLGALSASLLYEWMREKPEVS